MRSGIRERRRWLGALVAAAGMLAAGLVATTAAAPAQAAACQAVKYTVVNGWNGGHQAAVSITAGSSAISGWTIEFDMPSGSTIANAWNARVSQTGTKVTASDVGWNASVPAGTTAQAFGAVVSHSGSAFVAPTTFRVNGTTCGVEPTTSPSVVPTPTDPVSPSASPSVSPSPSSSPSVSPSVSPTPIPGCPAGATCDGFENQTGTTPGGDWKVGAENCSGTGTASVDSAVAHAGSKSVRVNGGAGYCNHQFVGRDIPAGTQWFRVWVRHSTAQPQTHTTMIAMNDANDGGRDLRLGGQNSALQWNRESDDATLPEQSPNGVALSKPLPTNTWTCIEWQVTGGSLSTWVNGTVVSGLVADGTPTQDIDSQWLRRAGWSPSLTDLRLGWESYGGDADTLWYDDVAYGSSRIGC